MGMREKIAPIRKRFSILGTPVGDYRPVSYAYGKLFSGTSFPSQKVCLCLYLESYKCNVFGTYLEYYYCGYVWGCRPMPHISQKDHAQPLPGRQYVSILHRLKVIKRQKMTIPKISPQQCNIFELWRIPLGGQWLPPRAIRFQKALFAGNICFADMKYRAASLRQQSYL